MTVDLAVYYHRYVTLGFREQLVTVTSERPVHGIGYWCDSVAGVPSFLPPQCFVTDGEGL